MDYSFFRDKKNDTENRATVITGKERKTGAYIAHVVPKKGVGGGWIVKQLIRDLHRFGHRKKLLLRSDQEPAITDLMSQVADAREGETLIEQSPVDDSRANGLAERSVQSIQKQVRILKLATERYLGTKFSVTHPCFPWLVMHAADVLTKGRVRKDGHTAYENIKQKKYTGMLLRFGCKVLHRIKV